MKILELKIKNIRGIKDIELKPNGENFVVWGRNGSGKSAIVDSIDFLLTGSISRLTGAGTGNITLKKHGAHIDCLDLKKSYVKAKVLLTGEKDPIEITRHLDKPKICEMPDEVKDRFASIENLANKGQHILTRKEILKFITSEGGKRAEEIQTILNLSEIENIRKSIGRVGGNFDNKVKNEEKNINDSKVTIVSRIGSQEFSEENIIGFINTKRQLLGGENINELKSELIKKDLKPPVISIAKYSVNIEELHTDIENITMLGLNEDGEIVEKDDDLRNLVSSIHEDSEILRNIRLQKLVEIGINLIDDSGRCPLCDTEWKPQQLKDLLQGKIESAKEYQNKIDIIDSDSQFLKNKALFIQKSLDRILNSFHILEISGYDELERWKPKIDELIRFFSDPLKNYHDPEFDSSQIKNFLAPENLVSLTDSLYKQSKLKLPETTPEQNAWDILTKLEVDIENFEKRRDDLSKAQLDNTIIEVIKQEFERIRDQVLTQLYDDIKDRFVELYRELHNDDERNFTAQLTPSGASLDFEVDFFGRGNFPPHALHSEGHQDSMGVCLFLALSEKLSKGVFDLIILDDVVMSVDINHRLNLCKLLKKNFPDKQFLITTHDRAWAMQLRNNGVVKSQGLTEFFNWDVDTGPYLNDVVDIWELIADDIEKGDVPSAAARLRRGSEQFFSEVCHNLGAPVRYHIDGQYELGELIQAAMSQFSKLIKKAKIAADSWNPKEQDDKGETASEIEDSIKILDEERREIFRELGAENWAVNINVHYNEWADFTREEFLPVVDSYHKLFELFKCKKCDSLLRVIYSGKTPQNIRCDCDFINWNLVGR